MVDGDKIIDVLNTFFEGLYISTFLNRNPAVKNIADNPEAQRKLHFYNSYHLKQKVDYYSEKIRRAKAFGVLVGKGINAKLKMHKIAHSKCTKKIR